MPLAEQDREVLGLVTGPPDGSRIIPAWVGWQIRSLTMLGHHRWDPPGVV
jgi:hypothetical protein